MGVFDPKDFHDITSAKLRKAGLPVPDIRKFSSVTSVDDFIDEWEAVKSKHGGLSDVPYTELSRYLDAWSALSTSARMVEALAQADLVTAEFNEKFVKKQVYLAVDSGNRELRDAKVYENADYKKSVEDYLQANRVYEYVHALRESYERYAFVISREISRRVSNLPQELRS